MLGSRPINYREDLLYMMRHFLVYIILNCEMLLLKQISSDMAVMLVFMGKYDCDKSKTLSTKSQIYSRCSFNNDVRFGCLAPWNSYLLWIMNIAQKQLWAAYQFKAVLSKWHPVKQLLLQFTIRWQEVHWKKFLFFLTVVISSNKRERDVF